MLELDHAELAVNDLDAAAEGYERLLGRTPALWLREDGARAAQFTFGGFSLKLVMPDGGGVASEHLRRRLQGRGEGLHALGFRTDALEAERQRLRKLALDPSITTPMTLVSERSGAERHGVGFSLPTERTGGLRLSLVEWSTPAADSEAGADAPMTGLDLVVVATAQPDRAAALYGARLGLPMVLDRLPAAGGGSRLMQFECATSMVEVIHNGSTPVDELDHVWGISWEVADADATRVRLAGLGFNVSPAVKLGAKPGTRVFTIRDRTFGAATLVMQRIDVEAWKAEKGRLEAAPA